MVFQESMTTNKKKIDTAYFFNDNVSFNKPKSKKKIFTANTGGLKLKWPKIKYERKRT